MSRNRSADKRHEEYLRTRERVLEKSKEPEFRARKRKTFRAWRLKTEYGLTVEEFEQMSAAQGGVCAICKMPPTGTRNNDQVLNIDHDHETDQVRGLLCCTCNRAIGLLKDDAALLDAAAIYLRSYS